MGSGIDWRWGVWDTEGVIDGLSVSSDRLFSTADYSAIADGGTLYDFNGVGDAAALLSDGTGTALVRGSAAINVRLGRSILADWNGTFSMNNSSGDSMSFDVTSGSFQGNGLMIGSPGGFSMSVNGMSFNSADIVNENIVGNLVGIGGGTPPSGAIGTAGFTLTGGASANAIFASDIAP